MAWLTATMTMGLGSRAGSRSGGGSGSRAWAARRRLGLMARLTATMMVGTATMAGLRGLRRLGAWLMLSASTGDGGHPGGPLGGR